MKDFIINEAKININPQLTNLLLSAEPKIIIKIPSTKKKIIGISYHAINMIAFFGF
jgi:hypothetical protein